MRAIIAGKRKWQPRDLRVRRIRVVSLLEAEVVLPNLDLTAGDGDQSRVAGVLQRPAPRDQQHQNGKRRRPTRAPTEEIKLMRPGGAA